MSSAGFGRPGEESAPENKAGQGSLDSELTAERVSTSVEQFSLLSGRMVNLLAEVSQEIRTAGEQLGEIRRAIENKKEELRRLGEIEASAAALEAAIENQRQQKESLQKMMEKQRASWEQEKSSRGQEEQEYLENLKIRRRRDEEEYQRRSAAERQKLENELLSVQQQILERKQSCEQECMERERKLEERELEWNRLVQELENFLSRLCGRFQPRSPVDDPASWQIVAGEESQSLDSEPIFGKDLVEDSAGLIRREFSPLRFVPRIPKPE